MDLFDKAVFPLSASIRIFGDRARAFCLPVFELRVSQRFRVEGDDFESSPYVDADIVSTYKNMYVFKNIRKRVVGP